MSSNPPRATSTPLHRVGLGLVLLAVLLGAPSLWAGLHGDDFPMGAHFSSWLDGTAAQPWWDAFALDVGDVRKRFGGLVPWWAADDLQVRFFRPLSAATHLVDYALWADSPPLMHGQSIVWFGALALSVWLLFRDRLPARHAAVAGAVYIASYVHAIPVGWLSNRNAVIAAVFGVLAFRAYVRWRERSGEFPAAPLLLLCSLLSAEAGIATLAYVVAFELTQGRAQARGRAWKLGIMLALAAAWAVAYRVTGFGAIGSGAYIHPLEAPWTFLQEAPGRLMWLLGFLLAPLRVVFIDGMPRVAIAALVVSFGIAAAAVLRAALRPENRMWALGSLFALGPLLAASPGDRLLTFATVGLSPLVAGVLLRWRETRLSRVTAGTAAFVHLVVSPAMLIVGGFDQSYTLRASRGRSALMRELTADDVRGRMLFIVHAPGQVVVDEMKAARVAEGLGLPAFTWTLMPAASAPAVDRIGCCSLRIHSERGMVGDPYVAYYRGPSRPFHVGDRVKTLGFTAEIESVTPEGGARTVRFDFAERLESKRLLFVRWNGSDFVRWSPPPPARSRERRAQ